jgi:hypothetical protein
MSDAATISAVVTLLHELDGPRVISHGKYRPHVVVGPSTQREAITEGRTLLEKYLGVAFVNAEGMLNPGEEAEVTMLLMYHPDVSYSELVPGATFTLREGPRIVGFGKVLAPAQQAVQGDGPASGGPALNAGVGRLGRVAVSWTCGHVDYRGPRLRTH